MLLGLGGNPIGPAGTGKTECIKSFGSFLGRLVLVFNCDEVFDFKLLLYLLYFRCDSRSKKRVKPFRWLL